MLGHKYVSREDLDFVKNFYKERSIALPFYLTVLDSLVDLDYNCKLDASKTTYSKYITINKPKSSLSNIRLRISDHVDEQFEFQKKNIRPSRTKAYKLFMDININKGPFFLNPILLKVNKYFNAKAFREVGWREDSTTS